MTRTHNEAKEIILKAISPKKAPELLTIELAKGRVLAKDIRAKFDIPEAPKSAIDGFTFDLESIKEYPATLKIIGESRAGGESCPSIKGAEAVFTMTGALVPKGADTAVRIEDVIVEGDRVTIQKAPRKGDLINPKGDEVKEGELILEAGALLDSKNIALLANLGFYQVYVYPRPKIGIIVTGDEVREPWENPDCIGVRNSNLYILKGLLSPYADIYYYGIIQDELDKMTPLFDQALKENDLLLSSGGASKGKYDFTKTIAKELNLDIDFTHTNIRPGRPLIFGRRKGEIFMGLPGYPSALMVNAITFLLPAIRKLAGLKNYKNSTISAITKEPLRSKMGRVDFVRVKLEVEDGKIFIKNSGSQQTSNFLTLAKSDALAILDEEHATAKEGDIVEILPFWEL